VRGLPKLAADNDFDYNVVEAYDQPWKAQLEGTVGARWGIFDADRHYKFSLTGPVVPIDNAVPRIVISVALGCLIAILLVSFAKNMQIALFLGAWSQLFSASLVQAVYKSIRLTVSPASFTWAEQHILFFMADQHWLSDSSVAFWYKLLLQTLAEPFAHLWGWLLAGFSLLFSVVSLLWIRALLMDASLGRAAILARSCFTVYGLGAIVFAMMFSTSGRYIDIPLPQFLLPLCVAFLLFVLRRQNFVRSTNDYLISLNGQFFNGTLAIFLLLASFACLWGEVGAMMGGSDFITMYPTLEKQIPRLAASILANHELLLWCVACVMLALPFRSVKQVE
jgi:hypothetical protein